MKIIILCLALFALAYGQEAVCVFGRESVETGEHNHLAPVACGIAGTDNGCQIFLKSYTTVSYAYAGSPANVYGDIVDVDKRASVDGAVFVPTPPNNVIYVGDRVPTINVNQAGTWALVFPEGTVADPAAPVSIDTLVVRSEEGVTIGDQTVWDTRDWNEINVQQRATLTLDAPAGYFATDDEFQVTTNSFETENDATIVLAGDIPLIDDVYFQIWATADIELGHRLKVRGAGENVYLAFIVADGGGDLILKNDSEQKSDNLAIWLRNDETGGEIVIGHDHLITGCVQAAGYLILHSHVTITGTNQAAN